MFDTFGYFHFNENIREFLRKGLRVTIGLALAIILFCNWRFKHPFIENQDLIGRWSKEAGVILEIRSNGKLTLIFPADIGTIIGTYLIKDDKITVVDIKATGTSQACIDRKQGIYSYLADEKSLTISIIKDECSSRSNLLPGTYIRQ